MEQRHHGIHQCKGFPLITLPKISFLFVAQEYHSIAILIAQDSSCKVRVVLVEAMMLVVLMVLVTEFWSCEVTNLVIKFTKKWR